MLGGLTLVTGPAKEPIGLDELRDPDHGGHLRVSHYLDDAFISDLIVVARERAEEFQARAYITQTWDYFLHGFPAGLRYIELPKPPLQSVTHVKYHLEDDSEQTFAASKYFVDTASVVGRIVLDEDESWPTDTLREANGVEVRFVAGYGTEQLHVPARIRHALKIMVADLYENRESFVMGQAPQVLPVAAERLLYQDRVFSFA